MIEGLSISELKNEKCPRISGADVVELLARRRSKHGYGKIVVLDVRPPEQYPFIKVLKCLFLLLHGHHYMKGSNFISYRRHKKISCTSGKWQWYTSYFM